MKRTKMSTRGLTKSSPECTVLCSCLECTLAAVVGKLCHQRYHSLTRPAEQPVGGGDNWGR